MTPETTASKDAPTRGYSATKEQLQTRLSRIEGQVRGIQRMVENARYSTDVTPKISPTRAAPNRGALGLPDDPPRHCIIGGKEEEQTDRTAELMGAVGRLMRRS